MTGNRHKDMKIATLVDVKAHFGAYIKQLKTAPVIVTKNGRPVARMIGFSDKDYVERFMLAILPKFQVLLDKAECRIQETDGISRDGVWAQSEDETKA